MKGKTKILSTIMTCVTVVISIVCYFVAINKDKSKQVVYAESVCFTNGVGGCELLIDNELILDNSLVTINPSNCSFEPEFKVAKYGSKDNPNVEKNNNKYKFNDTGKYIITCSVKSGKYDTSYTHATMTVKVVEEPTDNTNMYIQAKNNCSINVGESLDISSFANIVCYNQAEINVVTSKNITYSNGNITALNNGNAYIAITLKLFNILIYDKVDVYVSGKVKPETSDIMLTLEDKVYSNNDEITISMSSNSYVLGYELLNCVNQQITCSANNNNIEILISEAPFIVFKTLNAGKATIFITPIENPSITFEIYLIIE